MRTTTADARSTQKKETVAMDTFDALMKVVIIGDSSVGKTCLVLRYTQDIFRANFLSTIGRLKCGRTAEPRSMRSEC